MKRIAAVLLVMGLLLLPVRAEEVSVAAESWLLMEKETGEVIAEENARAPVIPASVTKVMTMLLVMEAIDSGTLRYEDTVTVSARAAGMGGVQVYLRENEQITVEELLKAVCISSGNDAAVALAEHIAGSEENFTAKMNHRAAELGMEDTCFLNCTGMSAEGHVTSTWDTALAARELLLHHPDVCRFTATWMDTIRSGTFSLASGNKLVRFYEGTTGLMAGSSREGGFSLCASARREDMELIAVVMGARRGADCFDGARSLLNLGFSRYSLLPVRPEAVLPPIPVSLGAKGSVQPVLGDSCTLLLDKALTAGVEQEVELPEALTAPVEPGQVLGELRVLSGGEVLRTVPIVAGEGVPRLTFGALFLRMLRLAFLWEGAEA